MWGLLSFLPAPAWIGAAALIALALGVWAWRWKKVDAVKTVGLFISPFIFAYNLMPLHVMFKPRRALLAMAALSWLGFVIADLQSNDRASALVAVCALILFGREWQAQTKLRRKSEDV